MLGQQLHSRGWHRAHSMAQEGANARATQRTGRTLPDRMLSFLGATRRELVLKELRAFMRDSTQWSQLVMLAVVLVVYVAIVRYLPLSRSGMTELLRNVIPFLNLALAGFVLASIAARFDFPSVSLEGRTLWLLRSSPLRMSDLLWAKFWVGAVPLLLLALEHAGCTNLMLGVRPFVLGEPSAGCDRAGLATHCPLCFSRGPAARFLPDGQTTTCPDRPHGRARCRHGVSPPSARVVQAAFA